MLGLILPRLKPTRAEVRQTRLENCHSTASWTLREQKYDIVVVKLVSLRTINLKAA